MSTSCSRKPESSVRNPSRNPLAGHQCCALPPSSLLHPLLGLLLWTLEHRVNHRVDLLVLVALLCQCTGWARAHACAAALAQTNIDLDQFLLRVLLVNDHIERLVLADWDTYAASVAQLLVDCGNDSFRL